jgi:hypothetical protein
MTAALRGEHRNCGRIPANSNAALGRAFWSGWTILLTGQREKVPNGRYRMKNNRLLSEKRLFDNVHTEKNIENANLDAPCTFNKTILVMRV